MLRASLVLAAAVLLLIVPAAAAAAPAIDGEFPIAGGLGTDNDIVQGPDGNMYVTLQNDNGFARITPAGVVTEFPLANTAFGIATGPDNNLWISTTIGVVKVSPNTPNTSTPFDVGLADGRGIVAGPDGRMWVAGGGELISFNPADPEGTADPTAIAGLVPHGVSVSSDGLIWIADGGGRVISATASATPTLTDHSIQIDNAGGAQDVAAGPNGQVAYAAPTTDPQSVGRINGVAGTALITELEASDPFGVTFANDGAYWFARARTNDLLRMTPDGQTTKLTGFSPTMNVGPRKIATGPNNTLWVTLDDQSKVARVTGVTPPSPPPNGNGAETTLDRTPKKKLKARDKANGKKGKATAKFKFSTTTAEATFECSLRKRSKDPKFKPCESPKKYKLKPGRYRFLVRAVLAGAPDATPDEFAFKVVRKKR